VGSRLIGEVLGVIVAIQRIDKQYSGANLSGVVKTFDQAVAFFMLSHRSGNETASGTWGCVSV